MNHKQTTINPQEVAKFTQLAHSWWDKDGELRTLHHINPARLLWIEKQVALEGKRILDVGCGGGILTEALAKAGGIVSGLDADASAIEVAKAHAETQGLVIEYHCAAIETYSGGPFDVITCMEMLEHVDDPALVIEHCNRLLKPGGLLLLSTINKTVKAYGQAIVMAEYVLGLIPKQTHDFKLFISPAELAGMLRKQALTVSDISGLAYNPLTGRASLVADAGVNYLMAAKSSI